MGKWISQQRLKKWDAKLSKLEVRGFHLANRYHRYAINICLMFAAYQMYTFLRDYNDFFLYAREVRKLDENSYEQGPINKSLNEQDQV